MTTILKTHIKTLLDKPLVRSLIRWFVIGVVLLWALAALNGEHIRLLTKLEELEQQASAGVLHFESLYGRTR